MKRNLFVEDDLSLAGGLDFAVFLARVNALLRRVGNFQQENTGLEKLVTVRRMG